MDDSKIEKLKGTLHGIGESGSSKHKIFLEQEAEVENFNVAEHFDTIDALVDRSFNRPRKDKLLAEAAGKVVSGKDLKRISKAKLRNYKELEQRAERSQKLAVALTKLNLQRSLLGKGTKRKITIERNDASAHADEPVVVYKWKRQRSK